jgi:hypothetical protein
VIRPELRPAAVFDSAPVLSGAAGGHALNMVRAHDFALGNTGVISWTDIPLPVVGLACA